MHFLEVQHIQKVYTTRFGGNKITALRDVNFSVEKGEFVAIMGESGAGKTTLLNIMATIDKPTSGKIILNGDPLSEFTDTKAHFFAENILVLYSKNLIFWIHFLYLIIFICHLF